jgi:site-specific recombinase XerD
MGKIDLYNHEKRYNAWKNLVSQKGEECLSNKNSDVLIKYIFDMEAGRNTNLKSKKGARSFHRLNALRQKVCWIFKKLQDRGIADITKIKDEQIQDFFNELRNGKIKTNKGEKYKSSGDYVKQFKAFWHWHQKVNRNKNIADITEYLDASTENKPFWVYLDDKQTKQIIDAVSAQYKTFLEFQWDSGCRVTEALSLNVRDITQENGVVYATISKEIAKSCGRKIKLILSGKNVLQYIKDNNLKQDEVLFPLSADYINWQLKQVVKKIFGDAVSKGGAKYSELSLYDFRHNSCCYWLPRYKSSIGLMYRFGWKSEKYIHYYSEFLGMKDTIRNEDLYCDITKTELESEIEKLKTQVKYLLEISEWQSIAPTTSLIKSYIKKKNMNISESDILKEFED